MTHSELFTQLIVQVRKWSDGLCGHQPLIRQNAELTALGGDYLTANKDVVTEVNQFFPKLKRFFANLVQRDHGLNALTGSSLHGCEAELAGVAQEHDAAGYRYLFAGCDVGFKVWVVSTNRLDGVGDR